MYYSYTGHLPIWILLSYLMVSDYYLIGIQKRRNTELVFAQTLVNFNMFCAIAESLSLTATAKFLLLSYFKLK